MNKINSPGPLLIQTCDQLIKMLIINNQISFVSGEAQVLQFHTNFGLVNINVQLQNQRQQYKTLEEKSHDEEHTDCLCCS